MSEKQTPDPKAESEDPKASTEASADATPQTPAAEETTPDANASTDEKKASADTSKDSSKDSSSDQKSKSSEKKPKDKNAIKRQELREKRAQELEERKAVRTKESKLVSRMKEPQTIADEIQIQRAGYELSRSKQVAVGRASTIYEAKKKHKDFEMCCKLIVLDNIPKPYADQLLKSSLKILRYAGSAGQEKAPKCQHFLRVFEMFLCQKKVFIFMERLQPLSLETRIRTKDTITEFDAKKWGKQLIEAIDCLQLAGVAHRNIRPENIVFDKQYNIKLVGFGVAVVFWDEKKQEVIQQPKEKAAKPKDYLRFDHMPVQCLTEETYDPSWVDIWSWGVVMCLCLHKQTPFEYKAKAKDMKPIEEQWTAYCTKYQFAVESKSLLDKCFATLPADADPSKRLSSYDILRHRWLAEKTSGKKPDSKKKGP